MFARPGFIGVAPGPSGSSSPSPSPSPGVAPIILFEVRLTTASVSKTSSFQKVIFNSVTTDSGSSYNAATGRFQPTTPGYYQLNWQTRVDGGVTAIASTLYRNGALYSGGSYAGAVSGSSVSGGSDSVYFNGTTDYAEVYVYSAGGTPTIIGNTGETRFSGHLVNPPVTTAPAPSPGAAGAAFSAALSADQTIPASTPTKLNFDTATYDLTASYNTASKRFVAPVAGVYDFNANAQGSTVAFSVCFIAFYKNGVEEKRTFQTGSGSFSSVSGSAKLYLAAGDYVEPYLYVSPSGGISKDARFTYFQGTFVRSP